MKRQKLQLAMKTANLKIALLTAVLALGMSPVRAAFDLNLGGTYSSISIVLDGTTTTEGGGSIDNSTLNERPSWVYCVDLFHDVYVPGDYNNTGVSTSGVVNGYTVNNAGEVAWLLAHYATTGHGIQAMALQAAIWHVIYDGSSGYAGNHTVNPDTGASYYTEYVTMLSALGSQTGNVSSFDWLSPGIANNSTVYQGLVAVPEPTTMVAGALLLLPFGASTLRMLRRRQAA
jgi:hypothetical protein